MLLRAPPQMRSTYIFGETMPWTLVLLSENAYKAIQMLGPQGKTEALKHFKSLLDGEIIALIAGTHEVHIPDTRP